MALIRFIWEEEGEEDDDGGGGGGDEDEDDSWNRNWYRNCDWM